MMKNIVVDHFLNHNIEEIKVKWTEECGTKRAAIYQCNKLKVQEKFCTLFLSIIKTNTTHHQRFAKDQAIDRGSHNTQARTTTAV